MQTIPVPAELVQAIADYLAIRPYREVAGLLAALQQAAQASAPSQQKPEGQASGDGVSPKA
jgi:hypothetical protein